VWGCATAAAKVATGAPPTTVSLPFALATLLLVRVFLLAVQQMLTMIFLTIDVYHSVEKKFPDPAGSV